MNVFLTGANGMLGTYIAHELLKKGHSIRALIQPGRENHNLDGLNIEMIYGDITDSEFVLQATQGCEVIINTAASTQVYPRRNPIIWKVNYEGALNLAEAALAHKMKRIIHIGSANSFEEGPIHNPGDETGHYTWGKFGMDYMDSKYHVQLKLRDLYETRHLPVIVINPGFMIGPFDSGPTSGKMLIAVVKKQVPGYTKGGKCFVYSGDVAIAVVNAIEMGKNGECYIAGNENLSYYDFFRKICTIAGIKFSLFKLPSSLTLAFGFFSSGIARLTRKAPKISFGMARIALVDQYYSNKKIITELQMPTTPIDVAITESMNWFKENKYLD
jgi:dihydroflavonol-4-reductase